MKKMSAAALAIAAAVKATGAHRYRYRVHSFVHDSVQIDVATGGPELDKTWKTLDELFRSDEHAFFVSCCQEHPPIKLRPGTPVRLRKGFDVRVVPSK